MASDIVQSSATRPHSQQDQFIQAQLGRMSRQVKMVDLLGSLIVLVVGLMAFLIAAAVVDHWIVSLGLVGRFVAFLLMIGGVGYYCARVIGPLLLGKINPTFAAHAIEQRQPSLKNSLVNFLMFRTQPTTVHSGVYEALEQRAAGDLSRVDMDLVVDRSKLFLMAYVLAGVFGIAAFYSVLSPKSTVQSVTRVMIPWADVARPSRVQIDEVTPGDATVFTGRQLAVSTRISGLYNNEQPTLYYTTADNQSVDVPVELLWDAVERRHHGMLPPSAAGVRQDLRYRIEAGDAATGNFLVRVQAEPTIVVERVEYDYPSYTRRPRAVVERQADIQGLEGTRVTIHARANYPITTARLDFDPLLAESGSRPAPSLLMKVDGHSAQVDFVLKLDAARRSSAHQSYQLRFITEEGQSSQHPTIHHIEVTPDLAPEIEILTPKAAKVEVPEDGRQLVEVRAVDPDFGLTRVTLRAVAGSEQLLDVELLRHAEGQLGQSVSSFNFEPRKLQLTAGSRVTVWAIAEDNRTLPSSDSFGPAGTIAPAGSGRATPAPNSARTRNYEIVVVPSKKRDTTPPTDDPAGTDQEPQGQGQSEQQMPGDGDADSGAQQKGSSGDGSEDAAGSDGAGDASENGDGKSGDSSDGGKQDGAGAGKQQGESGEGGSQQSGSAGQEGQEGQEGSAKSDATGSSGDSSSAGQDGAAEGTRGSRGDGDSQAQPPTHDGDIFERIEQFRQQQQAQQEQRSGQAKGGQNATGADGSSQTGDSEDGSPTGDTGASGQQGDAAGQGDPSQPDAGQTASRDSGQANNQSASPSSAAGSAKPDGQPKSEEPATGQAPEKGDPQTGKPDERDAEHGRGGDPNAGDGAEGGKPRGPRETQPSEALDRDPQPGEGAKPGQGDTGESGAGQRSDNDQGAVESQETNRDRPKSKQPDNAAEQRGDEAQSPSTSKHQSDSEGGEAGDRSGGGKQGGGQGANQKGNDSPGSNSSADEGAGAASEKGEGETASEAGDQQQADGKTGSSGSQRGDGSSSQAGEGNDTGGEDMGDASDARDTPGQPSPADAKDQGEPQPSENGSTGRRPGGGSVPTGGGTASDSDGTAPELPSEVPDGEKANLDYARKATDLTLDFLDRQKEQPDPGLLDELGWTADDMRKFVDRWKQMKDAATTDDAARRDLDESLRSLGLRPETSRLRGGGHQQGDAVRDLSDSGDISAPPAKYRSLFDAFKKGTSRVP